VKGLRRADAILAPLTWAVAGVLVLMLFFGPAVIASDTNNRGVAAAGSAMYGGGAGADGPTVFKQNCGSCHTLAAAATSGTVGPNLDASSFSVADIEAKVRSGGGGMPSFQGKLSDAQIKAVAAFIDASR
jgi:mono/diheme cytochrome c family protein